MSLDHTRFGDKEYTFTIGDPKKGAEAGDDPAADGHYTRVVDGAEEGDLDLSGSASAVADTPSERHRAGSYSSPADSGGMGQWGSKARSASHNDAMGPKSPQRPAAVTQVSPLLTQTTSGHGHGHSDGSRRHFPAEEARGDNGNGNGTGTVRPSTMGVTTVPDLMPSPPMEGKDPRRGVPGVADGRLAVAEDKEDARLPAEFREEKGPGTGGVTSPTDGGGGYGTFGSSPVPSPTYAAAPPRPPPHGGDRGSDGGEEGAVAVAAQDGPGPPSTPGALQPPVIFKERWKQKEARIRRKSAVGHLPGWRLLPVIVKSNDDLRQEQLASQLLRQMGVILKEANVGVWLRAYDIIATSFDGGLLEAIPDTVSLDALKKNDPQYTNLAGFFERLFGPRGSPPYGKARQCFLESMAAYSIICFLLQVGGWGEAREGWRLLAWGLRCGLARGRSRTGTMATSSWMPRGTSFTLTSASCSRGLPATSTLRVPLLRCEP
jgi:hypothetical protein